MELVVGGRLIYGHYEQDGSSANGAEPIRWRILDISNGNALVISESAIEASVFKNGSGGWETSDLREWMNGAFMNTAFTADERKAIESTLIEDVMYGNDRIFALSLDEAERYFYGSGDRIAHPTAASRRRVDVSGNSCGWWLRTPGDSGKAMYVTADGSCNESGAKMNASGIAARPAFWLNLSKAGLLNAVTIDHDAREGDFVTFGAYEQDGDPGNGSEPIEWLVLSRDGDRLTLISHYILDAQAYNVDNVEITWEDSSMRRWLNGEFIGTAFSPAEQEVLAEAELDNGGAGSDTYDAVYLLSYDEAGSFFANDDGRVATPTDAAAKKLYDHSWWLRTRGEKWSKSGVTEAPKMAKAVSPDGAIGYDSEVYYNDVGVRPVITVDLSGI